MKQKILQQEVILNRMQKLTADQILLSNELEQSLPPKDLLESLQNGFSEIRKNIRTLENKIVKLEEEIAKLHQKESALVFTSGYIANESTISSLLKLFIEVHLIMWFIDLKI